MNPIKEKKPKYTYGDFVNGYQGNSKPLTFDEFRERYNFPSYNNMLFPQIQQKREANNANAIQPINYNSSATPVTPVSANVTQPVETTPTTYGAYVENETIPKVQTVSTELENEKVETEPENENKPETTEKSAADVQLEKDIADARTSYQQQLATYGKQAESLGSMGLTRSGYSDYLNSQAYSQMRSDIQAAKGRAETAKREEATYAKNLYNDLLTGASNGTYTAEALETLAADYTEPERQALIDAANKYKTNQQHAIDAELAANTGDTKGYIDALEKSGAISGDTAIQKRNEYYQKNYNAYASDISNGLVTDTSEIDRAYESGEFGDVGSTEALNYYNQLKTKYNEGIVVNEALFEDSVGTNFSKSEAEKILNKYKNDKWIDPAKMEQIQKIYNDLYTPKTLGGGAGTVRLATRNEAGNNNGSTVSDNEGDDFQVVHVWKDSSGNEQTTKIYVESGGKVNETTNKLLYDIARGVADNSVFGYDGVLYIKVGQAIHKVVNRNSQREDEYKNLYNLFYPTT